MTNREQILIETRTRCIEAAVHIGYNTDARKVIEAAKRYEEYILAGIDLDNAEASDEDAAPRARGQRAGKEDKAA